MTKNIARMSIFSTLAALALAGCTAADTADARDAVDDVVEDVSNVVDELTAEMNDALVGVDGEFSELRTEVGQFTADASDAVKESWNETVSGLEAQRAMVEDGLARLATATGEEADAARAQLKRDMAELNRGMDRAKLLTVQESAEFKAAFSSRMDEFGNELSGFEGHLSELGEDAQAEMSEVAASIKERGQELGEMVERLADATGDEGREMRTSIADGLTELRRDFAEARRDLEMRLEPAGH